MTNESGQPENASYAQAKHAYERRNVLDQLRERQGRLEQGAEIRAAFEKACSAQSKEAQAAPSPETPAEKRIHTLKSAFTPERETALRDLESGKGSTLATARIFRAAPHLLDVLADTPLVRKVWELVQMLNAPEKWNGYLDAYWTTGQTVLWIVTGDPWVVDQASNDSGRLGELSGQLNAAVLIDNLNLPPEHVQDAADRLRRLCLDGTMTAIDGRNRPIPAIEWRHLEIVLDDGNVLAIQHVGQSTIMPAYSHVVFSRVEVLREFSPGGPSQDQDVTALRAGAEVIEPASQDAIEAQAINQAGDASEAEQALAAAKNGGAVHIEVEPYTIEKENSKDRPQIRLARWVAWQRWPDGRIPRNQVTEIRGALNIKLKDLAERNRVPLDLKDCVKPKGISLPTVYRLLGKRND